MSLLHYSGLTTKVRAMSGKLLAQEDFLQLGSLKSVPEVIAFLKKKPSYADFLEKEDERGLHRGQAEGIIMQSLFADYSRLYRFGNMEQRRFLKGYFIRYEITFLKRVIRSVFSQDATGIDTEEYRELFELHSSIPVNRALHASSMEELISTLDGTDYQKVLNDVYKSNSRELFDYELALDMFYFADMWHRVKRGMKAEDQQAILSSAGTQIDTLNLQWIYRAKKYYHMSAAQVYAMIIPIHYRLSREQIKRMAEAADEKEFLAEAEASRYGKYLKEGSLPNLDRSMEAVQEAVHDVLLRRKPYTAACLEVYLYRKEREVHKVITALECVRYGLPSEKIRAYLG